MTHEPDPDASVGARVASPVSDDELIRRWGLIRAAMVAAGIDMLLASANNDYMGGYVKYLTDEPAVMGYRLSVVLPANGQPSVLRHGPRSPKETVTPGSTELWRGPGELHRAPSFATVHYTNTYEAEVLVELLRSDAGGQRIGLLGLNQVSASTLDFLRRSLPSYEFVDCSAMVDAIKMIKSPEEVALIRRTAQIQDAVMWQIISAIRPGARESDITALARLMSEQMGSEQGTYLCGSSRPGDRRHIASRHYQNRQLRRGDLFYLLLEANGPGGYYAQLGRTFFLGRPERSIAEEYAFTLRAQELTRSLLVPGASCRAIWQRYNDFHAAEQRVNDEADRLHCHGQGYDIVEPPLVRWDEDGEIRAGMNIASHPVHTFRGTVSWLSENFIVGERGAGESIHRFPRDIVSVG